MYLQKVQSAYRHAAIGLMPTQDCGGSSLRGGFGTRGCLDHFGGHMTDPRSAVRFTIELGLPQSWPLVVLILVLVGFRVG
jgi:hypothetical protein